MLVHSWARWQSTALTPFLGILAFAAPANKRTNHFKDEEKEDFTAVKIMMSVEVQYYYYR